MNIKKLFFLTIALVGFSVSNQVLAADVIIKAGSRAFETPIAYAKVGDNIAFSNMNSHNSQSVEGLIPEGATPWLGGMGENIGFTATVPGIYSYVCLPHIGFGMVGVIVVGDVSADDLAVYKQKAIDTLEGPFRRLLGKINKIEPTT